MTKLVFTPGIEAIRKIEYFMDNLCENIFLNDTYYGNLLISLNTLNDWLFNKQYDSDVCVTYKTDYKQIRFIVEVVENQANTDASIFKKLDVNDITFEILNQLCNSINVINEQIVLEFEIGALHNSIYKSRVNLLNAYFEKQKVNSPNV